MMFPNWNSGSTGGRSVIEDTHACRGAFGGGGGPEVDPVGGNSEALWRAEGFGLERPAQLSLIPHGICLCGASGA